MEKRIHNLTYTLAMINIAACIIDDNIRVEFDAGEIDRLGSSLKQRQIHPIIVLDHSNGTYPVIDGGKRVRAARAAGISELLAAITTETLSHDDIVEIQLISAFHRSDPSNADKWRAMESVRAAHPDWSNARIAEHLSIDPKMVKVLLSPGLVIAEVRDAFCQGLLGISKVHEISLAPREQQMELLTLTLSGISRDAVAREARKRRNGQETVPAPRASKIKIPMPSGAVITLAGDELSLEDAIRELTDALAEMRKAEKQYLDIKTFQLMARDRAKAGA